MMNTNQYLKFASFLLHVLLAFGAFLVALELVGPLFGRSRLSVYAIVVHGNWIATSLAGRLLLNRIRKGLPIRAWDHLLGCLVGIVNLVGTFPNVIGIVLSILFIIGATFVYRARRRRLDKEQKQGSGYKN
jgi:membrane protein implicated in regulation of membrane protease activity